MIQDIAPLRLRNEYRPEAVPQPNDPAFVFADRSLALSANAHASSQRALPQVCDFSPNQRFTYLFELGGQAYWLACDAEAPAGFELVTLLDYRHTVAPPMPELYAAYTAFHLHTWYARNRFCGACGEPLHPHASLRALECPACGNLVFPRLNPAVIVAVTDPAANRIVLTRYANRPGAFYNALVAGFVEIGETVEECVAREAHEEIGLQVKNLRYYKSQPWGIAGDILMGFWCEVDGDTTIHCDDGELARAVWTAPEDVIAQPDNLSLTNEMMCVFRDQNGQV